QLLYPITFDKHIGNVYTSIIFRIKMSDSDFMEIIANPTYIILEERTSKKQFVQEIRIIQNGRYLYDWKKTEYFRKRKRVLTIFFLTHTHISSRNVSLFFRLTFPGQPRETLMRYMASCSFFKRRNSVLEHSAYGSLESTVAVVERVRCKSSTPPVISAPQLQCTRPELPWLASLLRVEFMLTVGTITITINLHDIL
ncbi:hypothetical protein L9F63_013733, partial [Diploptera punctata]